jgi:hypothetical protein
MGAALLFAAAAVQGAEPQLGRLFHTPSERAALEDARRKNIRAEALAAEPAKRPSVPRARIVTVTGLVQRSDGEAYVWVNGKQVEVNAAQRRMRVAPGLPAVLMRSADQGRSVEVKVGQRADLRTGRVDEAYVLKRGASQSEATAAAPQATRQPHAAAPVQRGAERQPRSPERDAESVLESEQDDGEG